MGCHQSTPINYVMNSSQCAMKEGKARASLSQIVQSNRPDQAKPTCPKGHRDVFSIFADHGMAVESRDAASPASPVGSAFSNATTASDSERALVHCPINQHLAGLQVSYGAYSDQGSRRQNEDRKVCTTQVVDIDTVAYFGLYDGHGGSQVAEYLSQSLHQNIFYNMEQSTNVSDCLRIAYQETDEDILKQRLVSGATAVSLVIKGNAVHVACVGDSQVIRSRNGRAESLCQMHTPTEQSERERIIAARGQISNGRIFGLLGVSRAFGDADFKTGRGEFKDRFNGDLVSSMPDIAQVELSHEDDFYVLGCDGLFDVMPPQQVADFVRNKLSLHGDVQHACEELVSYAIGIGSLDNVTAIVVCVNQDSSTDTGHASSPESCDQDGSS